MKGDIQINGKKVFVNGEEVTGAKKFLYLVFGYIVAAIAIVAVIGILLLVGGVVTIGIPVIIGFVLLCIFVSLIIGIVKMLFR